MAFLLLHNYTDFIIETAAFTVNPEDKQTIKIKIAVNANTLFFIILSLPTQSHLCSHSTQLCLPFFHSHPYDFQSMRMHIQCQQ